jgi:hypothetical protein
MSAPGVWSAHQNDRHMQADARFVHRLEPFVSRITEQLPSWLDEYSFQTQILDARIVSLTESCRVFEASTPPNPSRRPGCLAWKSAMCSFGMNAS